MKRVLLIAKLTFKEICRSRIYGFIVIFAFISSISIHLFSEFGSQEQDKLLQDIGLATITFFSLVLGIVLGVTSIQNDFETRSIYTVLAYPISGFQYLLGKFAGVVFLIFLAMSSMIFLFYFNLVVQKLNFLLYDAERTLSYSFILREALRDGLFKNLELLKAFLAIFLQCSMTCSISFLLANWLSAPFAMSGTIFLFLLGHVSGFVLNVSFLYHRVMGYIASLLLIWLPNFENFNIADAIVLGQKVSWAYMSYLGIYCLILLVFFLGLANQRLYFKISEL